MSRSIEVKAIISPIMSGIRTGNDGMRISFDIAETDVQAAVGLIALRNCPLKLTIEVDNSKPGQKPEKHREPKQSGPYGFYWEAMHHADFDSFPDLQETLNCSREQVHDQLARIFDVESLSFVGPRDFETYVRDSGLSEGLIAKSRNAEVKAAEKARKAS